MHVDVTNYLTAFLDSHTQQFQHTWRDCSIIFLRVIAIDGCDITVVCIHPRLLIQLVRRSIHTRTDC